MKKALCFPDIHSHQALFLCVHAFNLLPTRYIHASWLRDLAGDGQWDVRQMWKQNPRAEKHCAAWIIKTFCHGFIYDFSDSHRRLALLSGAGLVQLMVYTGLAMQARSIAQTISGRHINPLIRAFGPQAYEFVSTRATLLSGLRRFDFLLPQGADRHPRPGDVLESGRRCLQICLEGSPAPLVQRFRLKFPRHQPWDFTLRSGDAAIAVCRQLVQKILKMEMRPQWNTV